MNLRSCFSVHHPLLMRINRTGFPVLSAVLNLAESHLAAYTWPELDYLHLDLLACGGVTFRHSDIVRGVHAAWKPHILAAREIA